MAGYPMGCSNLFEGKAEFPARRKAGSRLALFALVGGLGLGALLMGCGSGVATAIPSAASKPATGVPGGPVLGYVWSGSDQTLRPMLGVVGSGQVGQSIVPAGTYLAGAATSATDLGLVEDDAGNLFLLDLPSPAVTRVATGVPAQAQIVFSPSGGSAIAYAPGGSSITMVSGLTGQPVVSMYAAPGGAAIASAAVSDSGALLVAMAGSPARIGTLSSAGQFAQLTTVGKFGGMSFLTGVDDALLADAGTSTVSRLSGVSKSPGVQMLGSTGVNQPQAVASSRDGRWAVVVNGGDQNTVRIDLTSGTPNAKLACLCQPNQLQTLAGGKAFRLNDLSSGPVWIADLSTTAPQMIFVPAIH